MFDDLDGKAFFVGDAGSVLDRKVYNAKNPQGSSVLNGKKERKRQKGMSHNGIEPPFSLSIHTEWGSMPA